MSFIASPAGEKAVEKRVEELCKEQGHYQVIHTYQPSNILMEHTVVIYGKCFHDAATKSAAYAAALIWLAERGD